MALTTGDIKRSTTTIQGLPKASVVDGIQTALAAYGAEPNQVLGTVHKASTALSKLATRLVPQDAAMFPGLESLFEAIRQLDNAGAVLRGAAPSNDPPYNMTCADLSE